MIINKVEICGVNTSELPVFKADQMRELLVKIKQGDEDARQKFVKGNLRLVLSVIQKFNNRGENVDDLFQIGCVGLIKAIDNFDLRAYQGTGQFRHKPRSQVFHLCRTYDYR